MTSDKKHIFGLCPDFCHRACKILEFPKYESNKGVVCYINEVTFGQHVTVEAGCQWRQPCDLRVGTFSPTH